MTRDEFEQFLIRPSSINEEQSELLRKTVEQFPYCQTSRLIYVAGLKERRSIAFDEELNLLSAYAADRKSLYHFLHPQDRLEANTQDLKNKKKKSKSKKTKKDEVDTPVVKMAQPFVLHEESEAKDEDKQNLTVEYLHEVVSNSLVFELENDAKNDEELDTDKKVEEIEKVQHHPDEKHGLSDWLNIFDQEEEVAPSQNALIDKFLEGDYRITAKPEKEGEVFNLARQSTNLHDELITETLAKIHVEQGNLQRAIEIYEKLSLKFPEKRSYFAAQIKFLKQKP